jgi:hypothetical protein
MSITIVASDLDQWAVLWAAQLASKQANGSSPMKRALASTLFTACLFAITDAQADIKDHDLVKDCSAMMGPWPPKTPEDRERLLSQLSSRDHELIKATLTDHPVLTAAQCIECVRNAGKALGRSAQ